MTKDREGGPWVLLVRRAKRGDWVLPKGGVEPGEGDREAALREVEEEAAVRCEISGEPLPDVPYGRPGEPARKLVALFPMRPVLELPFEANAETVERGWFPAGLAASLLSRSVERAAVALALLRDAEAGTGGAP